MEEGKLKKSICYKSRRSNDVTRFLIGKEIGSGFYGSVYNLLNMMVHPQT